MNDITQSASWEALLKHKMSMENIHMRELFDKNPNRFDTFSIKGPGLLFDYSKNIITSETLELLCDLAQQVDLSQKIDDLFSGKKINTTENRAVLHSALRYQGDQEIQVDNKDVMPEVRQVLKKISLSFGN